MAKRTLTNNGLGKPAKGTYFLELKLTDVRCFGPEQQVLDLSDGDGRAAQWTVLLGNYGTGKTTLLQCLAEFDSGPGQKPRGFWREEPIRVQRIGSAQHSELEATTLYANGTSSISLTLAEEPAAWGEEGVRPRPGDGRLPLCFGYHPAAPDRLFLAAAKRVAGDERTAFSTISRNSATLRSGSCASIMLPASHQKYGTHSGSGWNKFASC